MALLDDLLVQDLHLADHQQSKIGDEGLRKGIVRDRVALDADVLVNDIWGGRPIHRLGSPVYGLTDVDGSQPDFWTYLHAFHAERGQTFSEWVEQMDLS